LNETGRPEGVQGGEGRSSTKSRNKKFCSTFFPEFLVSICVRVGPSSQTTGPAASICMLLSYCESNLCRSAVLQVVYNSFSSVKHLGTRVAMRPATLAGGTPSAASEAAHRDSA
jgi:hypothetical protein